MKQRKLRVYGCPNAVTAVKLVALVTNEMGGFLPKEWLNLPYDFTGSHGLLY